MNNSCKHRLLIVDDEEGMRNTLRRIMVAKGYEVQVAANGREAVERAQQFQPHVLLMDIRMPGINGVEAYRQIKPICPDALTIFMSAFSSSELAREAIDEGAVQVIAKPLDIDNLCQLISQTGSGRPVLIVDDDPGFLASLDRALTALGFHIYSASSPENAVETFRRHPNCVVLLDLKLDGASGIEVLQQIRLLNQKVVALLMTGFADLHSEMQAGLAAGARCTFVKPFDIAKLADEIRMGIQDSADKIV